MIPPDSARAAEPTPDFWLVMNGAVIVETYHADVDAKQEARRRNGNVGREVYRVAPAYSAESVERLRAEVAAAREEIALDDKLLADRDRILDALPCPDHGRCVPYVLEQITAAREDTRRLDWIAANCSVEVGGPHWPNGDTLRNSVDVAREALAVDPESAGT